MNYIVIAALVHVKIALPAPVLDDSGLTPATC
jgi:hypothetical protein